MSETFQSKLWQALELSTGKVEFEIDQSGTSVFCASAGRPIPPDAPKDIERILTTSGWHCFPEAALDQLIESLKNPQPIKEGVS